MRDVIVRRVTGRGAVCPATPARTPATRRGRYAGRRAPRGLFGRAAVALLLLLTVCGCASSSSSSSSGTPADGASRDDGPARPERVRLPKPGMAFDYQLGGAYRPADRVRAVSRDRTDDPAPGRYNICYVNAFQTQPDKAVDWWRSHHPDLLLRDEDGELVIDEDWDEPLLDISTAHRRTALMKIVGPWIDGCAEDGFDAVEPDNLDSYQRSHALLDKRDAIAFARMLTARAHRAHLAVAQKNTAELLGDRSRTGFDFAVAEECGRYDECGQYGAAYRDRVFVIEYRQADLAPACEARDGRMSVVLRDRDLRPAGADGHVLRHC